ncbi:MAG TPA: carbon starvation CstA 5TM domain-containing protein, partial [Metalysinibacillus sp.]
LGVIILPITSGDTAFRAARMIIADYFNIGQKAFAKRLAIALPLFAMSYMLTKMDFQVLWRYFSWANQVTAVIALWVGAMYLFLGYKNHWIATIPAIFMTDMVYLYIFFEPTMGFGIPMTISHMMAVVATIVTVGVFFVAAYKKRGTSFTLDEDVSTFKEV